MRKILRQLILMGVVSLIFIHVQAQVTVTKRDSLKYDANGNLMANPGDSLRYKTKVLNPGAGNVTGAEIDINADGNLNMNNASIRTSPVAVNDAYDVTANVGIMVDSMNGLKINDFDDDYEGASIMPEIKATAMGGSVTINADGSFSYIPAAGFTGADDFTYTLLDGNELPGCPAENDAVVTLNVSAAVVIWFIDNSSVAAASDGRLQTPFKTLADFNNSAGPQEMHWVFVIYTGTNYTGGIVLKNGQVLYGTGHTGGANLADLFVEAPFSFSLPSINGMRPVIENAGGDGVTLGQGNMLRGFNVGNCSDFGMQYGVSGTIGSLGVEEVAITNNTGGGFDGGVGAGQSLALNFTSISSNGGVNGIILSGYGGTFNVLSGGMITNPSGTGVQISGGTLSFSYNGSITDNSGFAVDVDNNSGNVTFSDNITSTGSGIRVQNCTGGTKTFSGASKSLTTTTNNGVTLNNNTGATINFSGGGLVINTTSGTGFNATGGGTISVTGAGNTINATTGPANTNTATALNVANTTIGAGNLNFLSISSGNNNANPDPANGIVLNATGMSGGLIVTGTGTTNGSGGTIQNVTNRGISATSTINLSLKNITLNSANLADAAPCGAADNSGCNAAIHLNTVTSAILDNVDINGAQQQGINLREVSGFQLLNSTVVNTGGGSDTEEAGLYAVNLFGTCAITSTSITLPTERASVIYNTSKTLNLTVTGSTFGMNQAMPLGADAFEISSFGASNTTLDIVNSTFIQPKTNGLQVITEGTSFTSVDVTGSTFEAGPGLAAAIDLVTNGTGDMDFNIVNNPQIEGAGINIVNVFAFPNSTFEGRINNNTIVNNGGSGAGVRVVAQGNGNSRVEIKNNIITGDDDYGITTNAQGGSGRLDAIITGNTVSIGDLGFYAVHSAAGTSGSIFTNKLCAHVANNATTVAVGGIGNFQARAATPSHEILLQGVGASVAAVWDANLNTPTSATAIISQSGTGVFTFGATCNIPANPTP